MTEEELETTNRMKTMIIEEEFEEETSVVEKIEEFEDKIDYLDMENEKKEKLRKMCEEIKKEDNDSTREYLFKLLQKEINGCD